jgi:hypothetical protein
MTNRAARLVLALSGAVPLAGAAVYVLVITDSGRPFSPSIVPWAVFPIVWWAVGASIVVRSPDHLIGRLLTMVGVLAGCLVGGVGFIENPSLPAAPWAILLVSAVYGPLFVGLILGSMVLFPDGRLPTPAWRLPALVPVAMVLAATFVFVLRAGPIRRGLPDNPVGIAVLPEALYALDPIGIALLGLVGAASLAWRYRRGSSVVRAQLKWLLASVIPAVILTPISFFEADQSTHSLADFLSVSALLLVPVSIGVAITRYHLYEIDRLISRGLSWAVLTALLAGVYAGGVLILQSPLADVTQGQTLAVAASTLLAATLFQPLRGRLQRAMDRRFDRARYDGDRVVGALNERLRDQIDIDTLSAEVRCAAGEAVRPTASAVWLRTVPNRREVPVS